jgi:hypothetical protein
MSRALQPFEGVFYNYSSHIYQVCREKSLGSDPKMLGNLKSHLIDLTKS